MRKKINTKPQNIKKDKFEIRTQYFV